MYAVICSILTLVLFSTANMINLDTFDQNHFGPYAMSIREYGICAGPKPKNLTITEIYFSLEGNNTIGYFNTTPIIPSRIEEIKVSVYSLEDPDRKTLRWSYKINNPCKHFVVAKILETNMKIHNCYFNKGLYAGKLNMEDVGAIFFGTSFFYGEYFFRAVVTSKQGNICCLRILIKFSKPLD